MMEEPIMDNSSVVWQKNHPGDGPLFPGPLNGGNVMMDNSMPPFCPLPDQISHHGFPTPPGPTTPTLPGGPVTPGGPVNGQYGLVQGHPPIYSHGPPMQGGTDIMSGNGGSGCNSNGFMYMNQMPNTPGSRNSVSSTGSAGSASNIAPCGQPSGSNNPILVPSGPSSGPPIDSPSSGMNASSSNSQSNSPTVYGPHMSSPVYSNQIGQPCNSPIGYNQARPPPGQQAAFGDTSRPASSPRHQHHPAMLPFASPNRNQVDHPGQSMTSPRPSFMMSPVANQFELNGNEPPTLQPMNQSGGPPSANGISHHFGRTPANGHSQHVSPAQFSQHSLNIRQPNMDCYGPPIGVANSQQHLSPVRFHMSSPPRSVARDLDGSLLKSSGETLNANQRLSGGPPQAMSSSSALGQHPSQYRFTSPPGGHMRRPNFGHQSDVQHCCPPNDALLPQPAFGPPHSGPHVPHNMNVSPRPGPVQPVPLHHAGPSRMPPGPPMGRLPPASSHPLRMPFVGAPGGPVRPVHRHPSFPLFRPVGLHGHPGALPPHLMMPMHYCPTLEMRIDEMNRRLHQLSVRLFGIDPSVNGQAQQPPIDLNLWWDGFTSEFFSDDAKILLSFALEDGPRRYCIGRSLIGRYFRSMFDGGITELHYDVRGGREISSGLAEHGVVTLHTERCTITTFHVVPVFTQVLTEGRLTIDFAVRPDTPILRIRTFSLAIRRHRELIPRSLLLPLASSKLANDSSASGDGDSDQPSRSHEPPVEVLATNITRAGLSSATLNYLRLCVILEPMQELMARHKTYGLSPRDCLKSTLFQKWQKIVSPTAPDPPKTPSKRRKRKTNTDKGRATPSDCKQSLNRLPQPGPSGSRKRNASNASSASSSSKNLPLASHEVMVVGEPSLMGGDFGEEDERLISRLENIQFQQQQQQQHHHQTSPNFHPDGDVRSSNLDRSPAMAQAQARDHLDWPLCSRGGQASPQGMRGPHSCSPSYQQLPSVGIGPYQAVQNQSGPVSSMVPRRPSSATSSSHAELNVDKKFRLPPVSQLCRRDLVQDDACPDVDMNFDRPDSPCSEAMDFVGRMPPLDEASTSFSHTFADSVGPDSGGHSMDGRP